MRLTAANAFNQAVKLQSVQKAKSYQLSRCGRTLRRFKREAFPAGIGMGIDSRDRKRRIGFNEPGAILPEPRSVQKANPYQ